MPKAISSHKTHPTSPRNLIQTLGPQFLSKVNAFTVSLQVADEHARTSMNVCDRFST